MSEELFNTDDLLLNTQQHLIDDVKQTNTKSTEEDELSELDISLCFFVIFLIYFFLDFEQNDEYLEEAEAEAEDIVDNDEEENNIEEEPENDEEVDIAEADLNGEEELDAQDEDEPQSKKTRVEKITELPLSKIKFIVKTDPDVHSVSSEALFLITKTTEKFIQSLSREAWSFAQQQKRKTLKKTDIDQALSMLPVEL